MKIKRSGLIKGGEINITYCPDRQIAISTGHIKYGVGIFIKTELLHFQKSIPRSLFDLDKIVVGQEFEYEGYTIAVWKIESEGIINIRFHDKDENGHVRMKVSGAFYYVMGFSMTLYINGSRIDIESED